MRNIFSIHSLTYIIILSVLLCGYFNYFMTISIILLIHDLGHIILLKAYKYKINKITILPFGSIINSNINTSIKSSRLFLISIMGIMMQLVLYVIFYYLYNYLLINDITYNIFLFYNKLIIIFNLLPIIPLDGSKVLLSLLEVLFPYKISLYILNIISIITIIIFILTNTITLNLILISSYLLSRTIIEIYNHEYIFNNFLINRYLNKLSFRKIKYIKNKKYIYKNKYNFINNIKEEKIFYSYK